MLKKIIYFSLFSLSFLSGALIANDYPVYSDASNIPAIEEGNWLPELATQFPTMLGDPRIVGYSVGYRSYDKIFKTPSLPVSIGDKFTIYQFQCFANDRVYLGLEANVWSLFEARAKSLSLLNADYYVALPITYLNDRFSIRLRLSHQSSHLGDEFILEKKDVKRLNPSQEALDLFTSYSVTDSFMVFGGVGKVFRCDEHYRIKPYYFVAALNYQINELKVHLGNLEATPYIGYYCNVSQDNHWKMDNTLTIGYQCDKLYGHKMRLYLEGRDGFSDDGQFSKKRVQYVSLKLLYGY